MPQDINSEIKQILSEGNRKASDSNRSVLCALRDYQGLDTPSELPIRLEHEGTILVLAGTESPANTMAISMFYMIKYLEIMHRLREELFELGPEPSVAQLGSLPYLNAVIQEGNRLSFGIPGRVPRVAPEETLRYKDHVIPPGTPVCMTTLSIHSDPNLFPDPWSFKPDRWLGEAGKHHQKYLNSFGRGTRKCLGMNLANPEMFLGLCATVMYDFELYKIDVDDVEFKYDFQVAQPRLDPKGVRARVLKRVT